jgi:hypothetical protein
MKQLTRNLIITYSNQKARELKRSGMLNTFDEVITLSQLITDTFEKQHFEQIVDDLLGAVIVYHIIQSEKIDYFGYLKSGDESLQTIFDFIVKCRRNDVAFDALVAGEKLEAIDTIAQGYDAFKQVHGLVDRADVERRVLTSWDDRMLEGYETVYVDSFKVGEIDFVESMWQEREKIKVSIARFCESDVY